MICNNCGKQVPDDSTYCGFCGKKIQLICPKCGQTLSDDSVFCSFCGEKIIEADPSSTLVPSAVKKQSLALFKKKKKNYLLIAIASVLVISLAGNAFLGSKLSEKIAEIYNAEAKIEEYSSKVDRLTSRNSKLNSQITELNKAKSALETEHNEIKTFAAGNEPDAFNQYGDLYTFSNAVVIQKGKTAELSIVATTGGAISWRSDDTDVVSPVWKDGWKGNTATLQVTGKKTGTAEITITNSKNDHSFKILAIVTE